MKKIIIVLHISIMLLTILAFILFTFIKNPNFIYCETVLLISIIFNLTLITSKTDSVFKIGLMIFDGMITLLNYFLAMFMQESIKNNVNLFIIITLLTLEFIFLQTLKYTSKFTS